MVKASLWIAPILRRLLPWPTGREPPLSSPSSARLFHSLSTQSFLSLSSVSPLRSRESTSFAVLCSSARNPSSDEVFSKVSSLDLTNGASISSNASSAIEFLILCHRLKVVQNLGTLQNSHEGRISFVGLSGDGSALCTRSYDKNLKV